MLKQDSLDKYVASHKINKKEYGKDLVVDGTKWFGASWIPLNQEKRRGLLQ